MLKLVYLVTLMLSSVIGAPVPGADGIKVHSTTTINKRVTHVGQATWFHAGLGNCGYWDNDDTPIIAVSTAMYKQGGNCNQWVEVVNTANGKKVYAKMRDSCPTCGYDDVDLSPKAFEALASLSQGAFTTSWHFMNSNWSP